MCSRLNLRGGALVHFVWLNLRGGKFVSEFWPPAVYGLVYFRLDEK